MTPEEMEARDVVEFSDDEGNTLLLEVMDYFFYNGEEFAALCVFSFARDGAILVKSTFRGGLPCTAS